MKFSGSSLLAVIALVTVVKVVVLFSGVENIRTWEEHDMVLNLLTEGELYYVDDGARFYAFQFPIYPALLFCCYKFFGISPYAPAFIQVLLLSLSAWMCLGIFRFFYGELEAPQKHESAVCWLAAVALLLHPAINYYALCNLHPFTIDLFFLLLPLHFTARYFQQPSKTSFLFFSAVLGLAILNRATFVAAALPFLMLMWQKRGLLHSAKLAAVAAMVCVLLALPWLFRNYHTEGITGLSSMGGKLLWRGVMPGSGGGNYLSSGKNYYSAYSEEDFRLLPTMTAKEQNGYFMSKYKKLLREDPGHVIRMYFVKLNNFWLFRSGIGSDHPKLQRWLLPYQAAYIATLLLAIVGAVMAGRRGIALASLPVGLSLLQAIFYVETRHRLIIEPILIFLALIALFYLAQKLCHLKPEIP